MKIIDPEIEFVRRCGLEKVRLAYAVCYKNESKISWEKCEEWLTRVMKNGHTSPCEHLRLRIPFEEFRYKEERMTTLPYGFFSRIAVSRTGRFVNVNLRDWLAIGGEISDAKKYLEAEDYATVKIICNRGVSHELVRHREMSFTQESTRYCNYLGNMKFIKDTYENGFKGACKNLIWKLSCKISEILYNLLLKLGAKPQEARNVLTNSLKTEIWVTGTYKAWTDFFALRTAKGAHPQMRQICELILNDKRCPVEMRNWNYK